MSFDRYRAQTFCETILGCNDFEEFYNIPHTTIESFTLDAINSFALSNSLQQDAKDLYFKGCQSLTESILNFNNKLYSWAIIKAYYSTFYLIKADFAIRDYALIRHKCIYYLKASNGAIPITKGRKGSNRTDYSGDHKSALNYYKDLFSSSDILLSQEIEGQTAYQWLMKKREQVNYQERQFTEPSRPEFLDFISQKVETGNFLNLIEEIKNDVGYVLTFQPEYAPLAIPYKRAMLTKKNFADNGVIEILTPSQIEHLNNFAPYVFP